MNKDLVAVFEYLEREKGIKREIVIHAIEESLQVAAQKSVEGAANATVSINPRTGDIDVFCEKEIIENVRNSAQEISLEDAQEIDPDAELGQYIDVVVTPRDFGRIAAQKARQVITQKLRGAEKDVIYEEYRHRIGELVSGTVKRFIRGSKLVVDLGKVEAVMPMKNYPRNEQYRIGDKVLALLYDVVETENGGAEVVLTRSHPEFVRVLFDQEVPEISDNIVIIDRIVRDAGYRTKMTVRSTDPKVDPVGACVGMRGLRVKNVVRELNNEKIDIIPYSDDPIVLLQNALAPVEICKFSISEEDKTITIVVEVDDFPIVIGKRGMNAKLNGDLIGYELEVQKITDYNKSMHVQRLELSEMESPILEAKIDSIPGVNSMIFHNLAEAGYDTPKALLAASLEDLSQIPDMTLKMADHILETIQLEYSMKLKESEHE